MKTSELQVEVDRINQGRCNLDELAIYIEHPAALVRVNAINALSGDDSSDATSLLAKAALDGMNNCVNYIARNLW